MSRTLMLAAAMASLALVNPNDNTASRVSVDDTTSVQTAPSGRGTAVGGGITLLSQGDHWQRDLMIGTGVGILIGAAFGIYEVASQNNASTTVRRAEADPGSGNSNTAGLSFASLSGRF
jgi:hypothetical protein